MRTIAILVVFLALAFAAPSVLPAVEATHTGSRVVMPFGQTERFVPIVAGYEVVPRPLGCDTGTVAPTTVLFSENFDGASPRVTFAKNLVSSFPDDPNHYYNPWHVTTSIFQEKGTDAGHSGAGKIYFGNDATGKMRPAWPNTYSRLAGTASFPAFTVPAATSPTYMSWNDKFEVEGLFGYDHLWVELVSLTDGRVYLLCSTDTDVRPDKSSNDNEFSTCSPYRTMLCPTGIHGDGGLQCPTAVVTPIGVCLPFFVDFEDLGLNQIDPLAPHWESRYVRIPTELAGHTVVPRFAYDSSDGVANSYLGWMGDDVMISIGTPNPEPYAYVPTVG